MLYHNKKNVQNINSEEKREIKNKYFIKFIYFIKNFKQKLVKI